MGDTYVSSRPKSRTKKSCTAFFSRDCFLYSNDRLLSNDCVSNSCGATREGKRPNFCAASRPRHRASSEAVLSSEYFCALLRVIFLYPIRSNLIFVGIHSKISHRAFLRRCLCGVWNPSPSLCRESSHISNSSAISIFPAQLSLNAFVIHSPLVSCLVAVPVTVYRF
jgi:hypothetical protein